MCVEFLRVYVTVSMQILCMVYVGIFLYVCSLVFMMRLQDTPSVFTPFGKSPLPIQQEVPVPSGCHINSQT